MSDYPTQEELDTVKAWMFETPGMFEAFMDYVKSIGHYWPNDTFGWTETPPRQYHVSTGGWSGNEEILTAMQANATFWWVCWYEHRRGGHYVFELPDPETYFTKEQAT